MKRNTASDVWTRISVGTPDECWLWVGCVSTSGYGQFFFDGRLHTAHRVTYELTYGAIPDGLQVDHLCRNKRCCNPNHLEAVTGRENVKRAPEWNGNKTHCPQGHLYSGDNLYVRPTDGARICRTCNTLDSRERKRRRRQANLVQGLTTMGTPRKRPLKSSRGSGPGCPGTVKTQLNNN